MPSVADVAGVVDERLKRSFAGLAKNEITALTMFDGRQSTAPLSQSDRAPREMLVSGRHPCLACLFLLLSFFFVGRRLSADDWPRFLGPMGAGVSKETGLAKSWPEGGPPILWRRRVGPSFSAPSIAGDDLILFHQVGEKAVVECLEPRTAKQKWEFRYSTRYRDTYGYNNGPRSSPVISADRVYTLGVEGELYCLDRATGKVVWRRSLNKEYRVPQNFFGVGATPLLEGGLLFINVGGPDGAGVAALNAKTGGTVWKATNDGASYASPVSKTIRGKRYVFFFTKRGLVVVNQKTGRLHSTYFFRSPKHESVNAATPVLVNDMVFLSTAYGTGSVLLRVKEEGLQEVWKSMEMSNHWATSIYVDGYLYGVHGRHVEKSSLRCLQFETGKLMWQEEGLGRSSMIYADGLFYVLTEFGDLVLAQLTPRGYFERSRTGTPLSGPCYIAPVLANGRLYVRDEEQVLCMDVRERK